MEYQGSAHFTMQSQWEEEWFIFTVNTYYVI